MGRAEQELDILEQISQILGDGLELSQVFQRAMALLSDRLHIQRAALVLWDQASDQLRTVASIGLSPDEQKRGRYAVGEGVTGQVLATGTPAIISDIARHPAFLNRTGSRDLGNRDTPKTISFICVPVRDGGQSVGTISIDKPYLNDEQLQSDARLLTIIAGSIAQTIRIHDLIRVEKDQWLEETQLLRDNLRGKYKFDNIIGSSPAMLDVLATIGQVASSRATVLLLGETGCGKELIAKAIHFNSPRADQPLIRINCGALSPQLLESELFGHVKGAFTGAVKDKVGRFEAAEEAPSSSTRWVPSTHSYRSSSCASCRNVNSNASGTTVPYRWTPESSPPPTSTSKRRFAKATSVKTSITASMLCRSTSPRCANAGRTSHD